MPRISWAPEAISNLKEIFDYIAEDSPMNAENFIDQLLQYPDKALHFANSGKSIPGCSHPGVRYIFFKNYRIAFRAKGNDYEIAAVHHGSKLP